VVPILHLTIAGRIIATTAEHPFYVRERGWTPAGELQPGDQLASLDGPWLPLDAVADSGLLTTVYNFRVSNDHTYFVGTDAWSFAVWAHNAPYQPALGSAQADGAEVQVRLPGSKTGPATGRARWETLAVGGADLHVRDGRIYDGTTVLAYEQPTYTSKSAEHASAHGHAGNGPEIASSTVYPHAPAGQMQSRFLPHEGGQAFTNEVIARALELHQTFDAAGNQRATIQVQTTSSGGTRIVYTVPDLGRAVGFGQGGVAGGHVRGGRVVVEATPGRPLPRELRIGEIVTQHPFG